MNTPTILCVDDERNVLLTLRTQLMRHFPDYAIEIAESGDEALALVDQLRAEGIEVPLVIADQIMPGMHGDQLLIELHARYPEILKVMLTGQARAEDVGNVVNRGSLYRFIAKPWDETDLNLTVSEALRRYRQEQQLAQQQAALEQANRELLALNAELEQQVQERTQELRQREQQLRLFVQHTPLAVAMFDRQMRYLVASERWIKDYNLGDQAILGKCHYELFPNLPDDWREIHQRGLNGFVERNERDLYIRPDGSQEWVRWEVRPWYDLNHAIGGIIVFGEIITDRIQIELALQDSEERYRLLSEVNPVGIFRNDLQGRCIYANAKTLEITGLSLEENLGEGWGQHLHPDDRDRMYAAWSNFVQQTNLGHEVEYKVEHRYRYPDGSVKWALAQAVPEYNSAGELVGFIGSVVDITDRKLTEIALLEAQRIAHIGSWEFDLQTQVITWSEELYHMFGLDPSRPVPPYEEYLQKIHPDDRPKLLQCVEQAIASGTPYIIGYRIILPDGSIRYQEGRGEVIRNAQGQVVKLRGTALDISDRKQAELALQQLNEELEQRVQQRTQELARSEQDLRTIFNHVYDAIFIHDLDGTILDVNDRALELHTATREQLIGASIPDVFAPDAPIERLLKMLQRVQAGENLQFEWQGRRFDDGSIFDAEVSLRQVTLGNRPVLIAGVRDISDRKQAESQLAESEAKFRRLVESANDLVYMIGLDGCFTYLSPQFREMWGYEIADCLGKPFTRIVHPEDLPKVNDVAQWVLQNQQRSSGLEFRTQRQDGSWFWIVCNSAPIVDAKGDVVGLQGIARDLSDRKQAEADLRNSEERFRAAFEQAAVGMVQVDLEGRFTQMNQKFCDIVGYSESELMLKSFGEITHPDDLAADEANVGRLLAGEASTFVMEKRYFRKNGTIVWVNLSVSLVKNSAGEPQYFIAVVEDISSRKQAEQQLRAERLRLKLALEAADMGTWESNLETGIWSARTEEIFGYAPGTFPGDREAFLRLVHIDDQERVFAALSHSFATRSPYKVEYRINHLNGELRWVAVNGKVVESEDGSGLRMVGVALDITERKQAEEALRDSEERLRLALTSANQGLYDLNVQTGKAIVSPEYAAMLGYDPATFEETNAKWIERLHPDDIEPIAATYRAYVAGEIPDYRVEFRQRTQEGDWKWILSLGKIVAWDEAGQPLRMLGTHTDIDDRKRAEEELRQAISINQALLNAIPDLMLRMSRDGIYRDCIPSCNVILLTPHDELVGRSIWEILPADLAQQRLDAIERAFQTGLPQIHEYQIYIDGELRYEEARCVVCRDDEAMVLVRDITDRKRAEITLQQLNQELEQRIHDRTLELQKAMEAAEAANLAKSTFLANMSHELRTPLNAILGFAQLLSRDVTMAAEQRHQLAIINNSGKHLLNLINDILEMSKIEAGRIQFEASSFDLSLLLDLLEEMFQMRAREKGLHLIVERAAGLPRYVRTDEHKLRQVLINLLGNAIKFTLAGQVELHIRPSAGGLASELGLEFQVRDTGIGIASDELESLFEPFTQSRSRQVFQEGTGLGLSISRQFVQLLGGDLRVTSTQGVGSSFSFSIPVQRVEGAECPSTASGPAILGLAANQPSYRIVVAEDIETNRLLMVQLLQSLGFAVQSAGTGEEAIAIWEHWQPQLIWMDMRMPGMDGYEATRQIRARERQRVGEFVPTIIIALTASAFEEDRARVLAAGCDDFVRKPFQEAELLEKMAVYLGVEYVYAAAAENPVVASELDVMGALQSLPLPLLQQLYQATLELDSKQLTGLLQGVATEHPQLATLLLEKLENFDLEQILHLLQQAMKL
ncbi:MAG: hypothetical protein OHK0047_11380 [Leptolyngbyaceae cyanobacterium]